MRNILIISAAVFVMFVVIRSNFSITGTPHGSPPVQENCREISGTVSKGETLFDIFRRYSLDMDEFLKIKEASADIHRLKDLYPGRTYKILIDEQNKINAFSYWIDEDNILSITRTDSGFCAEKVCVDYEKRVQHIGGIIQDNLITSMGEGRENVMLALQLSDIFAWDIDFTTDLRKGDTFRIVVEGYYLDGQFRKYGDILSAEFANNGETYHAYRFVQNGEPEYYDDEGKSLRRAFLKAPLSFRRISSSFSKNRFHPILRIYRPHHGLDYAAPSGTPVSAVGEGTVLFAGHKGQYGKLVVLKHPNGWKTYYGHLSRIGKGVRQGKKVLQGQIIGHVGSTGVATGPHLHYELRIRNKPVNPLSIKMPKGKAIPGNLMAEFKDLKHRMDTEIASIALPYLADASGDTKNKL